MFLLLSFAWLLLLLYDTMSHDSNAGPSTRDNDIALPDAEHYEDMIRARLAMDKNTQMVIAENQTYRPKNTTAAYKSKQREWFVS